MEEDKVDRISDLPDDLLRLIIRSLPFKTRVQTRLLSTRWRDFYNTKHTHKSITITTSTLLKNRSNLPPGKFSTLMSHISKYSNPHPYRRDPTLVKRMLKEVRPFRLEFRSQQSGLVFVATLNETNHSLHLDFSNGHLADATLWQSCLQLMVDHLPDPFVIPIEVVRLTWVGKLHGEIVSSLLSNIRHLHTVEIWKPQPLPDLSVYGHVKLQRLWIIDCQAESIHVFADTLVQIRIRGRCPRVFFLVRRMFSDVMLDFRQALDQHTSDDVPMKYFLWDESYLKRARIVTMCRWTFEVMIRPRLFTDTKFDKLTELWWIDNCMKEGNVNSLITFLKLCPLLRKVFVTVDPKCYSLPRKDNLTIDTPMDAYMPNLRWVQMEGFEREEDELLLAHRLFKRPSAAVVSSGDACTRRVVRAFNPNRVKEEPCGKHLHMLI